MCTHHPRPGGRTTAIAVAAVTLSCSLASSASAASTVFGGQTNADEAIVVRADAKAKKLRSIAIAWEAQCTGGKFFSDSIELAPVGANSTPQPRRLLMSRNGKGRFAGKQIATYQLDTANAGVIVDISGRIRGRRASGTLAATVKILDTATGAVQDSCTTDTVRWTATRDPGRIYGGTSAQDEPVVVRLDRRRKKVAEVLFGWQSASCQPPDAFLRVGERATSFPLRHTRFGDAWDQSYNLDGGGKAAVSYALDGRVARRSATGTLQVKVEETDAAGAVTMTCDSGTVGWRTTTG